MSIDKQLASVMDRYPTLTQFGMGVYGRYECREDREKAIEENRQKLRDNAERVAWLVRWIEDNYTRIKSANRQRSSYGYKHQAEKFAPDGYVANGEFIAAALIVGLHPTFQVGPNVYFNISERSANAVDKRIREMSGRRVR